MLFVSVPYRRLLCFLPSSCLELFRMTPSSLSSISLSKKGTITISSCDRCSNMHPPCVSGLGTEFNLRHNKATRYSVRHAVLNLLSFCSRLLKRMLSSWKTSLRPLSQGLELSVRSRCSICAYDLFVLNYQPFLRFEIRTMKLLNQSIEHHSISFE